LLFLLLALESSFELGDVLGEFGLLGFELRDGLALLLQAMLERLGLFIGGEEVAFLHVEEGIKWKDW
jgi:hypothetical protein